MKTRNTKWPYSKHETRPPLLQTGHFLVVGGTYANVCWMFYTGATDRCRSSMEMAYGTPASRIQRRIAGIVTQTLLLYHVQPCRGVWWYQRSRKGARSWREEVLAAGGVCSNTSLLRTARPVITHFATPDDPRRTVGEAHCPSSYARVVDEVMY
jgi:hypothetical protein